MTAKLGLESTGAGSSRPAAVRRYLLPRLLLGAAVLAVLAVLAAWLFTPAAFRDVALRDDGAGSVAVDFRVSKAALLDSVTADLDGRPVGVLMLAPDTYKVEAPANGALTLTARTITGRVATWQADIAAVDGMPPKVVRDETRGGMMYIYFADEGAAGIDWASLTVTGAESGQTPAGVDVRQEEACVAFPFPAEPVRISLADRRGNPLTVLLQPAAAQPHAKPASVTPPRTAPLAEPPGTAAAAPGAADATPRTVTAGAITPPSRR